MSLIQGALAPDVLAFMQSYARPWHDRDPAAIASHYHSPLTLVRPGSLTSFASRQEVLAFSTHVLGTWFREGADDDVATSLAPPGARLDVVHVRWGGWVVRLPDNRSIAAPECDYVLARKDAGWTIVTIAVGW